MIKPTIGRKVWFRGNLPGVSSAYIDRNQPLDATIVFVHNDRCVNLRVTDHYGASRGVSSVILMQEGEVPNNLESWAEWMPYQQGQARAQAVGASGVPSYAGTNPPGA